MTDTNATLQALINARRPFKPFTVEGVVDKKGEPVVFYARRPGSGEQGELDNLFNKAYKEERDRINSDAAEMTLFRRNLQRQDAEDLLEYIMEVDSPDFEYEASRMFDEAPSDQEMEAAVLKLKLNRKEEMRKTFSKDDLIEEAVERQTHIRAFTAGTTATLKHVVIFTVHDSNKERLFSSVEDMSEVPEAVIMEMSNKSAEALKEAKGESRKDSPLEQADSTPSTEPSPSHGGSKAGTKRSSGRSIPTPT